MVWIQRKDDRFFGFNQQWVYTTEQGKTYTFSKIGALGNTLHLDTPIHFTPKAWQEAIDRGLGTHATSILTRARAHLGTYICLIEQTYGDIEHAPFAQRKKCELIQHAQQALRALQIEEQSVDPAHLNDGPLQEERFKHKVQQLLFNLRKDLVSIDKEAGSAMLGNADFIVSNAIHEVSEFHWPFATDAPETIEKFTRRRPISAQDQLDIAKDSYYQAKHEFPDGLTDQTRERLMNAIRFNDPEIKKSPTDFNAVRYELKQSQGFILTLAQSLFMPLSFFLSPIIVAINHGLMALDKTPVDERGYFSRFVQVIRTSIIGNIFNLLFNEPYLMLPPFLKWFEKTTPVKKAQLSPETVLQKLVSEAHAWRIASSIEPPFDNYDEKIDEALKDDPYMLQTPNDKRINSRILWFLCLQNKVNIQTMSLEEKQKISTALAPHYQLEDIEKQEFPAMIVPEGTQGLAFSRFGLLGTLSDIVDPFVSGIEQDGRTSPIITSAFTLAWAIPGGYFLGLAAGIGSNGVMGMALMKGLTMLTSIPGLNAKPDSLMVGPRGLLAFPGTAIQASSPLVDLGYARTHPMDTVTATAVTMALASQAIQDLEKQELSSLHTLMNKNTILNQHDMETLKQFIPPNDPNNESNLQDFLFQRYPQCVSSYGPRLDSNIESTSAWSEGLNWTLRQSYLNDLLGLRQNNPNAWTVLKQYPSIILHLTGLHPNQINDIAIMPSTPTSWAITTTFRAIHGLIGGILIGLPARLFYFLMDKEFPPKLRQYSGYNNLLGLIEGIPHFMSLTSRVLSSFNETFMHAKARIYDTATHFPKNFKSVPGYLGAIVATIPLLMVDAAIAVPSLLWNGLVALSRWIMGKPQRLAAKEYVYKLPLIGFFAEALIEPSFEERATKRIIQNNEDRHELFGATRSLTTAAAGDISSYRQSHHLISLLKQSTDQTDRDISINELLNSYLDYRQQKKFFSFDSYIMSKIGLFVEKKIDENIQSQQKIKESELLTFIFPREAKQLEQQFRLQNAKKYIDLENSDQLKDLNQACASAVYQGLCQLIKEELKTSPKSKTYSSTAKLFQILTPHSTQTPPPTEEPSPPSSSNEPVDDVDEDRPTIEP